MKKIFFAIICLTLWSSSAKADDTKASEEMLKLTAEFLAPYNGQLPEGITVNEDGKSLTLDTKVFMSNPEAKRYFEQMGRLLMSEGSVETESQFEINSLQMNEISEEQRATVAAKQRLKGPRKSRSIPQVTTCLYVDYTYMSVDGKNNPVRLSSRAYIPGAVQTSYTSKLGWSAAFIVPEIVTFIADMVKGVWNMVVGYTFDFGLLSCHPTVTLSDEAPTGDNPIDQNVYMFCSDYALVVCPDYCGYGLSEYRQHPYLVEGVTARNVVDSYIAALELIEGKTAATSLFGDYKLASDFYTDIIGYSQGGAVALATLRYLESGQVSEEKLKHFNLRNTYCGDGPYSPIATVQQYLDWSNGDDERYVNMAYPAVLPLIVQAAKAAYDYDCMHTVKVEDFFTEKFLSTGILDLLNTKRWSTAQLNKLTEEVGTRKIGEILSDKVIKKVKGVGNSGEEREYYAFNKETNEFKCLWRSFEYNDLTKGWTPKHPIAFMHYKEDAVVPFVNMMEVAHNIGTGSSTKLLFSDVERVRQEMTLLWELAATYFQNVFDNPNHESMGVFFYIAAAAGTFEDMLDDL